MLTMGVDMEEFWTRGGSREQNVLCGWKFISVQLLGKRQFGDKVKRISFIEGGGRWFFKGSGADGEGVSA